MHRILLNTEMPILLHKKSQYYQFDSPKCFHRGLDLPRVKRYFYSREALILTGVIYRPKSQLSLKCGTLYAQEVFSHNTYWVPFHGHYAKSPRGLLS